MTAEEMQTEIETVYAGRLGDRGGLTARVPPAGVTPLSWHLAIPAAAENLTRKQFRVQFGDHAGEELASVGLSHGCTQFARLTVQDREEVQVASQGGRGIPRKRPRAFIVRAIGWGHKVPEYTHTPTWPHAVGDAVPETSKLPKGDVQ